MFSIASAPAKCILTGEHAVVYGAHAIVLAIELRAFSKVKLTEDNNITITSTNLNIKEKFPAELVDYKKIGEKYLTPIWITACKVMEHLDTASGLEIIIRSNIPPGAGLGSSAAVSVATVAAVANALNTHLDKDTVSKIAFEAEKYIHGTPSGIDNTISTYGGALLYSRSKFTKIKFPKDLPLIIGYTGKQRNTGSLVSKVRYRRSVYSDIMDNIIKSIDFISIEAKKYLESENLKKLGELMEINQGLLYAMGVSTFDLDKFVYAAKNAGAYGAKLTGAGGGGCIVILSPPTHFQQVIDAIKENGGTPIETKIADTGVKIEESS
ncbi:MAG: mevalonate kinase [Candidatus Odinarchaeia archaeon]